MRCLHNQPCFVGTVTFDYKVTAIDFNAVADIVVFRVYGIFLLAFVAGIVVVVVKNVVSCGEVDHDLRVGIHLVGSVHFRHVILLQDVDQRFAGSHVFGSHAFLYVDHLVS